MGAKEGAMILELIHRLKQEGNLSMIMILHNYVHVLESCDRVNYSKIHSPKLVASNVFESKR